MPVATYSTPKFRHVTDPNDLLTGRPRSQPATAQTPRKRNPGAGLLLIVLLSLGLWVTIWKAVWSVAGGWLG